VSSSRIVLVDPRQLLRDVIVGALELDHDLEVAATADDPSTAALQAARTRPAVVVVAAALLGPLPRLCAELSALEPRPRTLVIDARPDGEALLHAIEAGADGYLTADASLAEIADAVRSLVRGESVVPPLMLGPLLRGLITRQREATRASEQLECLTKRERQVLGLLTEGLNDRGIAERLVISPETARTHVQRILRKLDVHSRLDAIALVAATEGTERFERIIERSTP
jgi:DNA-binding NarL/FixJ family response regulator